MPLTRPTTYPDWARNDVQSPAPPTGSGKWNVVEPSEGEKNLGWDFKQYPPRQHFNWLSRWTYKWLRWLDQQEREHDARIFSSEGHIANLDYTVYDSVLGLSPRMNTAEGDINTLETTVNTPSTGLSARMTTAEGDIGDLENKLVAPLNTLATIQDVYFVAAVNFNIQYRNTNGAMVLSFPAIAGTPSGVFPTELAINTTTVWPSSIVCASNVFCQFTVHSGGAANLKSGIIRLPRTNTDAILLLINDSTLDSGKGMFTTTGWASTGDKGFPKQTITFVAG